MNENNCVATVRIIVVLFVAVRDGIGSHNNYIIAAGSWRTMNCVAHSNFYGNKNLLLIQMVLL